MAVPKKKTSKRRTAQRRAHDKLTMTALAKCPKCGELKIPHQACKTCGYYNDIKVIDIETKLDKKLKKSENKESNQEQEK